jgi:hypothetical protein
MSKRPAGTLWSAFIGTHAELYNRLMDLRVHRDFSPGERKAIRALARGLHTMATRTGPLRRPKRTHPCLALAVDLRR